MTTYRLLSAPMVHTPGLVNAARATGESDFNYWVKVFVDGYNLPREAAVALIRSEVGFTIEHDGATVVFTFPAEPEAEGA
jgi:hypothetical protein